MVSYGVSTVSVRFINKFTTVHGGITTDNKGKLTIATTVPYGATTVKPAAPRAPTISRDCLRFNGCHDNDFGG